MKEYLFYTFEGNTTSPTNRDVENCQLLGRETGENYSQAEEKLLQNNPWIEETGFDIDEIYHFQIVSDRTQE